MLAETLLGDLLLRVQPPLRLELGPIDAAQLGHGHEERVERGIDHLRVGLRARELGQAVVGGQLAGEELPGAIDGLAQYLAARFHLHLPAQRCGLFLQALECARARAGQPLHVAHATGAEIFLRGLGRILAERLVGGELILGHAGLLRAGKERHQAARLLGGLDRLVGGQHAVEHAAHVVGERARGRVAREEVLDAAIHVQQPGAEPAEHRLQLDARGIAFGQVQLEGLGELLVIGALFLEVERAPLVQVAQAEPLHQRLHVAQHAALALGELVGVVGLHAGRHVGHHFEEEVAGLVQEGREIGRLQQGDRVGCGVEAAARGGRAGRSLRAGELMQDVRVARVVGAAVSGGGLDLLGAGGNHHRFGLAVERRRRVPHDDSVKALVQRIQERLPGAIGWRFDQRQHAAAVAPPLDNFRVLQRYIDGHDVRRALGVFRIRARAGHVLVDLAVPAF